MKEIIYKEGKTPEEVRALLWYFLRKRKLDARLLLGKSDIVVFVERLPRCIIKCRSWTPLYGLVQKYIKNNKQRVEDCKGHYGLPVLVCGRQTDIDKTIAAVKEILKPV